MPLLDAVGRLGMESMLYKLRIYVSGAEVGIWTIQDGESSVIGRSSDADIVIPDRSVSRRHCRVKLVPGGVEFEDLDSANGLFVDGRVLKSFVGRDGDAVNLGTAQIRVSQPSANTGMISVAEFASELDGFDSVSDSDVSDGGLHLSSDSGARDVARTITATSGDDHSLSAISAERPEYRALEKERLALLIETSKNLGQSTDIDELLNRIMDHLFQLLPVKRAVIALTDDAGETFNLAVVRPEDEDADVSRSASQGILRDVYERQAGRIIEDAALDQKLKGNMSIIAGNVRAALCAPIMARDVCLGAVYADYPGKPRLYSQADLEFMTAFTSIAGITISNARMHAELQAKARIENELDIASEIQKGILPNDTLTVEGLDIDWAYWPSESVGGDFFDLIELDDDRVCVLLGDVSGKSVPAALYMFQILTILRTAVSSDTTPGEVFRRANELLDTESDRCVFATTFMMFINPKTREIEWSNAGHNPVVVHGAESGVRTLDGQGPPLGIMPGLDYVTESFQVEPGTLITIYTDGLVEAHSRTGDEFGMERMIGLVQEHHTERPGDVTKALLTDVRRFMEGSEYRRDDIAILNIRVLPAPTDIDEA